jgi:energy-coupling factor transporter ATP-binding protein EcfA2
VISFGTVVPTDAEKFEGVPTLGLAPVVIEQLSKALGELRRTTPITLLVGEQNVTFALPHADRVYVLDHGRATWEGIRPALQAKWAVDIYEDTYQVLRNAKFSGSDLCDRSKIPGDVRRVLSDPDYRVADKAIGRHGQIVRSRHAAENAASQIVF